MTDPRVASLIAECGSDWISTTLSDRLVRARDASLYRLVPAAVAFPRSVDEVRSLLSACRSSGLHLTFRAAGTSLSGQAVTDGVLVDLSRGWDRIEILEQGALVRVQPGITGGRVNGLLTRYGRKIGPDPASINAAMVGGIVANNASGMCCGTAQNSYHTITSIRLMLSDGTEVDTASNSADEHLQRQRPDVYQGLLDLRDAVRRNSDLTALIRRKYGIKNTMGYSLNAFLDEDSPSRILGRLMVGSEGTLGFVCEVTYRTIEDPAEKHTGLFLYDSIDAACAAVDDFRDAGAAAVEIMDDASIRSFSTLAHTPLQWRVYAPGRAALLVEFHGKPPSRPGPWFTDPATRATLWELRKGLMPTVGALRSPGSTMINEDIAVPPVHLAALVHDLQQAFRDHGFDRAIIFGHAKDGNLHFVIDQDFSRAGEVERYARFMEAVAEIVADRYQGSLKAEHGTGRNMAPYVEREWGSTAMAIMRRLKHLCDPEGILNPDVLLSSDPSIHLRNLKPVPIVDPLVNACIECGFCEHGCPTRESTLTPRQRIVLQRELEILSDGADKRALQQESQWLSDGSCAVDGICATSCPVGIDTGAWVKQRRSKTTGTLQSAVAAFAAGHPRVVDAVMRLASAPARLLFTDRMGTLGTPDTMASSSVAAPDAVFVPSCPGRWFGTDAHGVATSELMEGLARKAGISILRLPSGSLCCGQLYSSRGLSEAATRSITHGRDVLCDLGLADGVPLVTDVSTCGASFASHADTYRRPVLTPTAFLETVLLPRLTVTSRFDHVVVHPGCGVSTSHDTARLMHIAAWCGQRVSVPPSASCCGMAGDHGMRHPEIVQAALRQEVDDLEVIGAADAWVTMNPICQSALTRHSGRTWTSVWHLVAEAVDARGY